MSEDKYKEIKYYRNGSINNINENDINKVHYKLIFHDNRVSRSMIETY